MAIRVALHHRTSYRYDRPVRLGPQVVRLRPAPHCRTPVPSYSLVVRPSEHFVNWQQDPHGNYLARLVFPEPAEEFSVEVDLTADLTVHNPFDFFLEESARHVPFGYDESVAMDLRPFLEAEAPGPLLRQFLASIDLSTPTTTVDFLVDLNRRVSEEVRYLVRMEPGVQTPEETLRIGSGSCRDSGWLLVQVLRHLGLAARFVSGYLIQLVADQKSLDGPSGPPADFTDLHAWAEVYLPGAGWVGLDPTSGLLAGEGHLPLACTPVPGSAAPISGAVDRAEVEFEFDMKVERIHEDPRVTKPYTEEQWAEIDRLGRAVDERLERGGVRLTMGGEPTFVSIDDFDGEEWTIAALGPEKLRLAQRLLKRLKRRFATGGVLQNAQGKWYPGEPLPRWALGCYWRRDGVPLWQDDDLFADEEAPGRFDASHAERLAAEIAARLSVDDRFLVPAFEDAVYHLWVENRLPTDIDVGDERLADDSERRRLARILDQGLHRPVGHVLPLRRAWWSEGDPWQSGAWPVRAERMFLVPGDSPMGLRLPLDSLPFATRAHEPYPQDPMAPRSALSPRPEARRPLEQARDWSGDDDRDEDDAVARRSRPEPSDEIRTGLCVEPREGRLNVFLPPVDRLEDYVDLVQAVEGAARALSMPVALEGYPPPSDSRLRRLQLTPDPGVIEVNIQPSSSWQELIDTTEGLYEDARLSRLTTEKFDLDGSHTGTGGGNHVVLGAETTDESPFLRRPRLLRSLLGFWQNHPSLSYLFSGKFVGPTSQAPRVDEGRTDALYELEVAFAEIAALPEDSPPWKVDRIFRHLLTDLTGNTHRAEFSIDKLYSPDQSTGRLGLLEMRGFEMPPHARMSLTQQLLVRSLVARFWDEPYDTPPTDWGTALHDRFLLPHYAWRDFCNVLEDLGRAGFPFEPEWFHSHFEFRFPVLGRVSYDDVELELRSAIEPWYVLGEEPVGGATARFVDSSVERLQVRVSGFSGERFVLACNGRRVPLATTGASGEHVAGVRYRAWAPPSCLHPTIPRHAPLRFDLVDTWSGRVATGAEYHVGHPGGRHFDTFPVNANEAEGRRSARFVPTVHSAGTVEIPPAEYNPKFPTTLDLRRPTRAA